MNNHEARKLYADGLNLNEIAKSLGVNPKTVSAWKKDDKKHGVDWDKTRLAKSRGLIESLSASLMIELVELVSEQVSAIKSFDANPIEKIDAIAKLMDSYNKGVGSCQKLMPEVHQNQAVLWTIEQLMEHVSQKHPTFLKDFANIADSFVDELE